MGFLSAVGSSTRGLPTVVSTFTFNILVMNVLICFSAVFHYFLCVLVPAALSLIRPLLVVESGKDHRK